MQLAIIAYMEEITATGGVCRSQTLENARNIHSQLSSSYILHTQPHTQLLLLLLLIIIIGKLVFSFKKIIKKYRRGGRDPGRRPTQLKKKNQKAPTDLLLLHRGPACKTRTTYTTHHFYFSSIIWNIYKVQYYSYKISQLYTTIYTLII